MDNHALQINKKFDDAINNMCRYYEDQISERHSVIEQTSAEQARNNTFSEAGFRKFHEQQLSEIQRIRSRIEEKRSELEAERQQQLTR